jgi:hypothetical protein
MGHHSLADAVAARAQAGDCVQSIARLEASCVHAITNRYCFS